MRKALLSLLLVAALPVMASHIVGGEFELLHTSGNNYQLNLILYFDLINGNPGAKDYTANISIYRKSDNQLITIATANLVNETSVPYSQPNCAVGQLRTAKLIYTTNITLDPAVYKDPSGYYMSWQRCCRNYSITNIYSQDPSSGGLSAGQTFYMEFPAVVQNGKSFYNSSPHLFPPLSDYALIGQPYYVDFSGVDPDGDSLVYSMAIPLNTSSATAFPITSPAPYPNITWRPGFGLAHIMNGNPDLRITANGLLRCTPTITGLFVFAVKVEQYRNKEKIGETRRDFQMLVIDSPIKYYPPEILGKKLTDASYTYKDNMDVTFSGTVPDESRCIQVQVSDRTSLTNGQATETIKVIALNFKSTSVTSVLPAVTKAVLTNGSKATFRICFPQCPFINGPYQIGIVVYNNACPVPLTDTLKVTVNTELPYNTPPYFTHPLATVTQSLKEGDQASWPFEIKDDQQDDIVTSILTNGFVLSNAGITYTITKQQKGVVQGKVSWNAYCDIYDFTKRTDFQVTLQADDNDACKADLPIKRIFNLSVVLPPVDSPLIYTDLVNTHTRTINLEKRVYENINFNVYATEQTDQSTIYLNLTDLTSLTQYGIEFANASGKKYVSSKFNWDILCAKVDPSKKSNFTFQFIASDNTNKCHIIKSDTVSVNVKVSNPINNKPVLAVASLNSLQLNNGTMNVALGQPIELALTGTDANNDNLSLKLTSATGTVAPSGYNFADATGKGTVTQTFLWTPDCSIFKNGVYSNQYKFIFKLSDDHCYTAKSDSAIVNIDIKDKENTSGEFLPANVITPNGDGCNDYFAVEGFDDSRCGPTNGLLAGQEADAKVSLPVDNCTRRFQGVVIYNRWGLEVFKSSDRKFRWYARNEAAGVYFYLIKYSNKEYKGSISVRN